VSIGLGVTVLTRSLIAALDTDVATIPISDAPSAKLGMAWRAGGYRSPVTAAFLQLARRTLVTPGGDVPRPIASDARGG
jgi:DNA-binding transcriptional LysR family regulator